MKTVMILTMPRSGSSLLAGILHRLGIRMGDSTDMEMGKHLNKHGCYEDQWFQSISLNILFESQLLLDITRRLNMDEKRIEKVVKKYEPEIKQFIQQNNQGLWGFKDPALIYHLPYYHSLFDNPYYIHLKRNTRDTAGSLFKTFRYSYWLPEMKEKFPLFKPGNRMRIILRSAKLLLTRQNEYNEHDIFERVIDKGHQRIREFIKDKPHLSLRVVRSDRITTPTSG
ncbi:MAG: sulfotransferase [candidate division KSB1 bacterium]|nr:sulfotransferase [candidate division KSB1 bacterium]